MAGLDLAAQGWDQLGQLVLSYHIVTTINNVSMYWTNTWVYSWSEGMKGIWSQVLVSVLVLVFMYVNCFLV